MTSRSDNELALPSGRVQLSLFDQSTMNQQPVCFRASVNPNSLLPADYMPPYVRGSDTSKLAAASQNPSCDLNKIMVFLSSRMDGATCDEVEVALQMRHQTASARMRDLKNAGVVGPRINQNTGKSIRRPTRTGRSAEVMYLLEPIDLW